MPLPKLDSKLKLDSKPLPKLELKLQTHLKLELELGLALEPTLNPTLNLTMKLYTAEAAATKSELASYASLNTECNALGQTC